jgi:hypothetical protein
VHSTQPGSEVVLIALLGQVALQMELAGTIPPHRFGIAALLGQHLLVILRGRAASLRDSLGHHETETLDYNPLPPGFHHANGPMEVFAMPPYGPFVSGFDPFLTAPPLPNENDLTAEGFADILQELFGQGFGGMSCYR